MADNLALSDYTVGGDYDTWGDKVIADFNALNSAAGDVETISTTSGTVTLTQAQSNKAAHVFTGTLTGNLTVGVIASIGRIWYVRNATSGAFTVTYQVTGGAGASVTITQGYSGFVYSNGTDCFKLDLATASGTIVAAQIASDAVTTAKILDANVTTAKIADSNVTTAKIADSNVTAAKIADANVTTAKILDANVTTAKLADNAVTLAKMATQANYTVLGNVSGGVAVPTAITLQNDDTFASASATTLATSLSIKNYISATAFSSALPGQAGNGGKFVTTDGTNASWALPEFGTDVFRLNDDADATKQVAFATAGLTTETTRTITVPDKDGTLAMTSDVPTVAPQAEARAGTNNTKFMSPLRVREARLMRSNIQSSAYTAVAADFGLEITCSSTWTLALTAAATLGDGWYCYVRNIGSGVITIDPNNSETIDGATTLTLKAGAVLMVHCNGSSFRTFGKSGPVLISSVTVSSPVSAIDFTTGIDGTYEHYLLEWAGLGPSSATNLLLKQRRASDNVWGAYFSGWQVGGYTSGTFANAFTAGLEFDAGTPSTGVARFSRVGVAGISYVDVNARRKAVGADATVIGGAFCSTTINGLRLEPSSGTINAGTAKLIGIKLS